MAYSTIVGADVAPPYPSGREAERLGPSDSSDSGSDTIGTSEAQADSDAAGTGERASVVLGAPSEGNDILPDHVVKVGEDEVPEAQQDTTDFTDLDASDASPGESDEGDEDRADT